MRELTKLLVSLGVDAETYQKRLTPHLEAAEQELTIAMITERVLVLQERLAKAESVCEPKVADESLAIRVLKAMASCSATNARQPWHHIVNTAQRSDAQNYRCIATWALKQEPDGPLTSDALVELERRRTFAKIALGGSEAIPDDFPPISGGESLRDFCRRLDTWITEQRGAHEKEGSTP